MYGCIHERMKRALKYGPEKNGAACMLSRSPDITARETEKCVLG